MHEDLNDYKIGLVSDTHGHLSAELKAAFTGMDLIIHAGDVDRQEVLCDLSLIAPVKAVRGNVDVGIWANSLPKTQIVQAQENLFYVLHDLDQLDINPYHSHYDAVIFGHSHRPTLFHKNGIRFINPGSPTHPRGDSAPSAAILRINARRMNITFVSFD